MVQHGSPVFHTIACFQQNCSIRRDYHGMTAEDRVTCCAAAVCRHYKHLVFYGAGLGQDAPLIDPCSRPLGRNHEEVGPECCLFPQEFRIA